MIYQVRHITTYDYSRKVELGSHLAHLLPRSSRSSQRVLTCQLRSDPPANFQRDECDHFGNRVTWLTIEQPHIRFNVEAVSRVDVASVSLPAEDETPEWSSLAELVRLGQDGAWRAAEFTMPSPLLPSSGEAGAYARESFSPGTPILAGLRDLNRRIHRDFTFRTGVTTLRSTVGDVMRGRAGVCQDFTHLMIAGLRHLGLPARYMSGYIRTRPAPGADKRPGSDVSHAWVGAWLGTAHGWIGLDPTNDLVVTDQHVVLGWGRDYSDVSPLFGVILGGGRHTLKVSVDLAPQE
jgi:transglutaminase-like putative cysteine protease